MGKRSSFVAPRVVSSFDEVQAALRDVQEALDAATMSRSKLKLYTSDFPLVAGSFHRASANGTIRARLPAATGENLSDPIYLSLEGMNGTLEVWAAPGQSVNGGPTASFSVDGIIALWSNGVNAWSGIAQVPAESPAGEALDANYILGAAHASLPNGSVATDTSEINVTVTPGVTATWALIDGGIGLPRFANVAAGTFLGNVTGSSGPVTANALSTLAGGGLTYSLGVMAVGAGTRITVNANDVAWAGMIVRNEALSNLGTALEIGGGDSATINELFSVVGSFAELAYEVNLGATFAWTGAHSFSNVVRGIGIFDATLISGTNSNLAIGAVNTVRCVGPGGGATCSLTGMVPTADGQWVFIENTSATDVVVLIHDATSTAANRFYCPALQDHAISIRGGVWARYDGTLQRWMLAIPKFIGVSSISLSPTTHQGVTAITLTEGDGINISTSASGGVGSNNVTIDIELAAMPANTVKANVTAGSAVPTDHSLGTLAGSGLAYSAGVMSVDTSAVIPAILEIRYNDAADASISESVPAGCTWFEVEGVGGGGGGGGADADDIKDASGGSGGGAGAWFRHRIAVVSGTITGAIGAAGTAGSNTGGNGGNGGATTVTYNSVTYTANGGNGGDGVTSAASPAGNSQLWIAQGSLGGVEDTTATERASGGDGGPGFGFSVSAVPNSAVGGNGGASKFGGGGRGGRVIADGVASNGTAGVAPGSGGGGGARTSTGAASTGAVGGAGAPGAMKITFYSGTKPTEATIN